MRNMRIRGMRAPVLALALAAAGAARGQSGEDTRAALEKWVETKRLISRERQDWRVEKEWIGERIQLMRRETAALEESTGQFEAGTGEADRKLAESQAAIEELKAAVGGLGEAVAGIEKRVLALLASAPAPIAERVKPLSQRIPNPGAPTRMGLSERFQNVVGILNEMNKFSREVTITSEVRDLPDGTKAEVSVLYLGLAQAYYGNVASGVAGIGRPGPSGWAWEPGGVTAQAVADAIAIHRNEKPAGYVLLPAKVVGP